MELLICNNWIATHISKIMYEYMHEFQTYENKLLRPSYAYLFRKVTSQLGVKNV